MDIAEDSTVRKGLDQLAADARRDLARLNHPPANWVLPRKGPDGSAALDVLIVGAGMCGQTAAFALLREGVSNPINPRESLTDRLRAASDQIDLVEQAALRFEDLGRRLQAALDAGNAEQACTWLRGLFGPRFPDRPDRVKVGAVASGVAAAIAASPAIAGPSELVGRTRAG